MVKKIGALLCSVLLGGIMLALPVQAQAAENQTVQGAYAQQLPIALAGPEGLALGRLTDGQVSTRLVLEEAATLTLQSESPVSALYLIFDRPVQWRLAFGQGPGEARGLDGFLHEYVPLASPKKQMELRLPAGARLCEVYAFGPGEMPEWVQQWQPPCEKADLLVLPTHADDEHLWFGGAMPYYAGELGYAVQVVYMTNHWAEPYRPHELLDGLWTVGVTNYPVISPFADLYASKESLESAKQVYSEAAILDYQILMLRRFKPEVVLAHDLNGEYGHGAHQLNAETLLAAVAQSQSMSRSPETAREYGPWQVKKAYLHLWPENTLQMEWSQLPLKRFGGRSALDVAKAGFACHASQTQWFVVEERGHNDCRKFGLAFTTVGLDEAKNDFFEHTPRAVTQQPAA